MLGKLLALLFGVLLVGKLFFKPQMKVVRIWFDALVNAMLVAITLTWSVQLLLYFWGR